MLPQWLEKIKSHETPVFIMLFSVLLVLTLVGGYKFYELQKSHAPPIFEKQAFSIPVGESSQKLYVASKNSSKYYPVNCKNVSKINEENKLYFETETDAQKAGFSRSKSCP